MDEDAKIVIVRDGWAISYRPEWVRVELTENGIALRLHEGKQTYEYVIPPDKYSLSELYKKLFLYYYGEKSVVITLDEEESNTSEGWGFEEL